VHGAGGDLSIEPLLYLIENGPAIRLLPQPENGEQYSLLEIAKDVRHEAYNVAFARECQVVSDMLRQDLYRRMTNGSFKITCARTSRIFASPYFSRRRFASSAANLWYRSSNEGGRRNIPSVSRRNAS